MHLSVKFAQRRGERVFHWFAKAGSGLVSTLGRRRLRVPSLKHPCGASDEQRKADVQGLTWFCFSGDFWSFWALLIRYLLGMIWFIFSRLLEGKSKLFLLCCSFFDFLEVLRIFGPGAIAFCSR